MAVVSRRSVLAAGAYPEAVEEEPTLEFGPAQAIAPRKREIKWIYLTPLVFLFLPLINYGARAAGFSPKTRLVMMFAGVFTGAGHGAVSIFKAAQDGDNAVDEDRERHAERRRRGLE